MPTVFTVEPNSTGYERMLTLVDPVWRLCGFMDLSRIQSIDEPVYVEHNVAMLERRPTSTWRRQMLESCLRSPVLSDDQRRFTQAELAYLKCTDHDSRSQTLQPKGPFRQILRDGAPSGTKHLPVVPPSMEPDATRISWRHGAEVSVREGISAVAT